MGLIISNYVGGTPRAIARALGWKVAKPAEGKVRKVRDVINYGTTKRIIAVPPRLQGLRLLNEPLHVELAVWKHRTLDILKAAEVPCLEFTIDPEVAKTWLPDGRSVVCRTVLNGHSGKGIHIVKWADWKAGGRGVPQFPQGVKLFTKYFPKQAEVRVHVFAGEVIGYAEKRRKTGVQADKWVRSHANGWIFATEGVERSEAAMDCARRACAALGLDFGAVDVGIGADGTAVLEVNTAPGLEGRTLAAYVERFKQHFTQRGQR